MKMSATTVRRGLYGMLAGGLLAGSAAIVTPAANAQQDPGACSASAIATTSSTVSASTSTYLASHPETNDDLTRIVTQSPAEPTQAFRAYFAENPQVETELRAINQPVLDLSNQCDIEVTPTPIAEALSDL